MTDRTSLNVTTSRLDAASSEEEVIEAIQEIIVNLIGSEQMAIFTLDRVSQSLSLRHADGIATWRYRKVSLDAGAIGRVAATGEPYVAADTDGEPDTPDLTACFPLKLGGTVTGVVAIFRLLPQKACLEVMDCELLESLGTHAAAALHRTVPRSELR